MTQEYHILIEGYAKPGKNGEYLASSTSTLIIDGYQKILVDPGTNKDKLLRSLHGLSLETSDITAIYLTHYHPDHFYNLSLFPEIEIFDGVMHWSGDKEIGISDVIPGTHIKIIPTPGHCPEHSSLLIETESEGTLCIAQDVFWWEDGKQDSSSRDALLTLEDPFATDLVALRKSREKVLEVADWIIPGHGKLFKNPQ